MISFNSPRKKILYLTLTGLLLLAGVYLLDVHTPPAPVEPGFSLAFLGDVMLGRGVAQAHAGSERSWGLALKAINPQLAAADLALANLESPLTSEPMLAAGYDLRAPGAAAKALSAAGLDLVSLANNHALDAGQAGLSDTQASLQAAGVGWIGPQSPVVFRHVQGQRLAFLAFEDVTAPLDLAVVKQAVGRARTQADLVIVSMHWGGEYRSAPDTRQEQLAQALADAGADVVWGQHPHVLQRLDWVQGVGRSRLTLVIYSLGNALFDQVEPQDGRRGALLLLRFGTNRIERVQALPFFIDSLRGQVFVAGQADAALILERLGPLVQPLPAPAFKLP